MNSNKNVLFIGARKRIEPFFNYCKSKNYSTYVYEYSRSPSNVSERMFNEAHDSINNFIPDQIILGKCNHAQIEFDYLQAFGCDVSYNEEVKDFFLSKSKQDEICNEIGIPTVSNVSDKVIVKEDVAGNSGGENFYITNRQKVVGDNIFVQDYMDIDKIISVHVYADKNGKWHIMTYGCMEYKNNRNMRYHTPFFPVDDHIHNCVNKLQQRLHVNNKILYWQFLNGYYHMDFNCRVSGGNENGTFDTDIGNYSFSECVFEGKVPNEIRYTHRVKLEYTNPRRFGYSSCSRSRIPLVYDKSSERYEEVAS